jgi:thiol-disulfide isomerase/thioredoxin/tetratricopeptide (TPR) repeat protein
MVSRLLFTDVGSVGDIRQIAYRAIQAGAAGRSYWVPSVSSAMITLEMKGESAADHTSPLPVIHSKPALRTILFAMRRLILLLFQAMALDIVGLSATPAAGQYDGTAAAKAAFDKGELAQRSDHYDEAMADFRTAISLDPNFAQAHEEYISARRSEPYRALRARAGSDDNKTTVEERNHAKADVQQITKSLADEYEGLARQHPSSAIYLWALGKIYENSEPARQEGYCKQAVKIDPKFALSFECLADMSYNRGDQQEAINNQKHVIALLPQDPDQFFSYTFYLDDDPEAYKSAIDEMLKRFPDSPKSAQAVYWYAVHQPTDATQIGSFERLRKLFPPEKFDWSENGMWNLFHIYNRTDPAKAQALAHEMLKLFPTDDDWIAYAAFSDEMAKAAQEVEGSPAAALATLEAIQHPGRLVDTRRKDLLQARALDLEGETAKAYAFLVGCYAKHPTDEVRTAIEQYGNKLGKTSQEIADTIWSAIATASTPAIPFSLPDFTDGRNVLLDDYKGHVVILDFWYPTCGPCRESFPYLQQVAARFKDRGVVVLAINQNEMEEVQVLPLLKRKRYDFIPLKGTQEWVSQYYHVRSFPTTFLVGADGRLYFRLKFSDRNEERTDELEIEELLAHR